MVPNSFNELNCGVRVMFYIKGSGLNPKGHPNVFLWVETVELNDVVLLLLEIEDLPLKTV